jgi:hypothetical protein
MFRVLMNTECFLMTGCGATRRGYGLTVWAAMTLLGVSLGIGSVATARGAVIYNRDTTNTNAGLWSKNGGVGLSFQTTAQLFTITEISFWHEKPSSSDDTGNLIVELWDATGSSNFAGNQIGSALATVALSTIPDDTIQQLSVGGLNITLSPSTNYWATITLANNTNSTSNVQWHTYTGSSAGTVTGSLGAGSLDNQNGGQTWPSDGQLLLNTFVAGSVTAVPEPGSLGLAGIAAVAGLTLYRRRRRQAMLQSAA